MRMLMLPVLNHSAFLSYHKRACANWTKIKLHNEAKSYIPLSLYVITKTALIPREYIDKYAHFLLRLEGWDCWHLIM